MTEAEKQSRSRRVTQTVQGGLVTLLTVPTMLGPIVGGWLASRQSGSLTRGTSLSAIAGLLGAIPWAVGGFLAANGAVNTTNITLGPASIGVEAVSPETLIFWQEIGIALALGATVVGLAVCGGLAGYHSSDSVRAPQTAGE
jgi:hypothetical protein